MALAPAIADHATAASWSDCRRDATREAMRVAVLLLCAWVLLVLLGLAAAGCATFKNTPQQDYVWEAGRVCDRQVAFWKMDRVESNGHYWIQGATNGPPGRDDYFACMQEQFTRNPAGAC